MDENFLYGGSMKNPIFARVHEKPIYRGDCLKRGAKEGGVLEGVDTPMHTIISQLHLLL